MKTAKLIVCERSNYWTVALRWALRGTSIRVHDTHTGGAARRLLDDAPASVLMLELQDAFSDEFVTELPQFGSRYPLACLVAVGRDPRPLWLARQLGAAHTVDSIRDLTPTIRLVRRHLEMAEDRPASFRERVWDSIPWDNNDIKRDS